MGASVRVEDHAFSDPRIELLGSLAGYNRFEALGRLTHLWRVCTHRETYVATDALVTACLGERGVDALLGAELGERCAEGIRVRGTVGRTEWLSTRRAASAKGGQAKSALSTPRPKPKAPRSKPNGSQTEAKYEPNASPPTPTASSPAVADPPSEEESSPPSATRGSPHQSAVAEIYGLYERTHGGAKPTPSKRFFGDVSTLVGTHGLPEIIRRVHNAESAPPAFPPAPYTTDDFVRHFDRFAVAAPASSRGRPAWNQQSDVTAVALSELRRLEREESEAITHGGTP